MFQQSASLEEQVGQSPRLFCATGALTLIGGGVAVLAALDVIPTPDSEFGAPRWIVALLASAFVFVGAMLLLASAPAVLRLARTPPWLSAAREGLRLLVVFVFINGSAIFLVWQTASPLPESGHLTVSGFSLPLPASWSAMLTRGLLALCALIMVALAFLTWRAACRRVLALRRTPST